MRCAVIDIGSNTTRLLVAEPAGGALRAVLQQRAFTRIGKATRADGAIGPEKIAEVAEVVATQVRLAQELAAQPVRAVATAAVRAASNADELVAAIRAAAGIDVAVLDGEEEARLAFAGATRTLGHAPLGVVGVADVGGGSSDLAVGTLAGGVTWSASLDIGSGLLADAHLRSDPPSAAELEAVRRHVDEAFAGLEVPRTEHAIAVGGSATSLRRLVGAVLEHETLERGIRVLAQTPVAEVARRFELDPERARLLPAGIVILEQAASVFAQPLQIARGGLREGVIFEILDAAGGGTPEGRVASAGRASTRP
jgi:exopolyphosphatase/guanosine-5'-triphosphate,3'-diphosphate pyrophosphatase